MNTIPLSALAPTTRARLEALAVEWLGINPWGVTALFGSTGASWWVGKPRVKALPLHIDAGFDLGVRLYAESEHISVADAHANFRDDPMRIGVETPADRQPEARLRVMLLDLGRGDARALAADLVRAADAVEPMVERSCYTCAYNKNNGGLPLDRSIPCPGHAPKVTT